MKICLLSFVLFTSGLISTALAGDNDDIKHQPFFEKLKKAYNDSNSKPVDTREFKTREQVWLGECVNNYNFSGPFYWRGEYYLSVISHKVAPGEEPEVQFASIDVGGNPYDSPRHIERPEDAIWFLRGDAGGRISLGYQSTDLNALVAEYYERGDLIALKKGKLEGKNVYLYVHLKGGTQIVKACYFDERVL
jgi:hypothetical protein